MRDYPNAIKAWEMARKCGMNPRIAMTRMGDAYMSLDDLQRAESKYKEALALGYDKYASLGMARIYTKKKQLNEVSRIFSVLLEKMPNNPRIAAEFKGLIEKYPQLELARRI
jgi:tetratricopeptide (TPR) repeat protein